jgi:hypothetical protein
VHKVGNDGGERAVIMDCDCIVDGKSGHDDSTGTDQRTAECENDSAHDRYVGDLSSYGKICTKMEDKLLFERRQHRLDWAAGISKGSSVETVLG